MRKAVSADFDRILHFLNKDIDNCIYMNIDISTYGVESENITTWIFENAADIQFVVLKYYNSFQLYGAKEFDNWGQIIDLIKKNNPSMISGPRWCIEALERLVSSYETVYGSVFKFNMYYSEGNYNDIQIADEEDATEIAKLILSDKEFAANYSLDELSQQLRDRIRLGYGRSFVIRKDDRIVAHVATFAESNKCAVLSGTVVDSKYRKTDLYESLSGKVGNILIEEGKTGYAFALNQKMIRWLRYCHIECGQYGKMVKRGASDGVGC